MIYANKKIKYIKERNTDNGKLFERAGRKATGPTAKAMAARPSKVSSLETEGE